MKKGKERGARRAAPTLDLLQAVILAAAVALIVGGVTGYAIYRDRVEPMRTTVLIVDDLSVQMRYFLKRVRMYGREPLEVLELLTQELIVAQVAPNPPYNIEVTDRDVEDRMRGIARAGADSITDAEVREWYRQALNDSELKDAEFRELIRRNLLALRMTEYLVAMVGERAEAREMDPETRQAANAAAITAWFEQEYRRHDVEVHGFTNGYDTETDLWVKWQLQRMARRGQGS